MRIHSLFISLFPLIFLLPSLTVCIPVGICYGRDADNQPPPSTVIKLFKSNGITTVRLFNIDATTLKAFSGTGISLIVGIPNENLPDLASGNENTTLKWLQTNIFTHVPPTQVKYIAAGNEVFLKNPHYVPYLVPAMLNIYKALRTLGLTRNIKVSSPQAASVLSSSNPPSAGSFDPSLQSDLAHFLEFVHDSMAPFMLNAYPYQSYLDNSTEANLEYALFRSKETVQDGSLTYTNLFDATVDAVVNALEKEGFDGVKVVVTETGWPTAGGEAASVGNALAYNGNVTSQVLNDIGTPKRPNEDEVGTPERPNLGELEVYLYDLFDGNTGNKTEGEYEKHFGIFKLNGEKAYDLKFSKSLD